MAKNKYKGYISVDQWNNDVELFRKHPNDDLFLKTMIARYDETKTEVKKEIEVHLQDYMMEFMPKELIKQVAMTHPDCFAVIKSDDDIWFEV